ncbi:MAG: V-type ATP synthase subunit I [Thermoplasmata archaeon]
MRFVLRPERMTRAVMVGPRDKLANAIVALHDLKLVHIIDHHGEDDTFRIGKPLPPAAELSENLVKLRSIANILAVKTPPKEKEPVRLEELRQKILALELNIREEDSARKKAESLLSDLDRRIEELRPFAALGLPLDAYRGYESIAVLVGRVSKDVHDSELGSPAEVFRAPGVLAIFVPKAVSETVLGALARFGFTQLDIPTGEGDPRALLEEALANREKWSLRLEEIQGRLDKLRERYAAFVISAEAALEVEVDKAEAPLRFAVSDHSFVIDGWVPTSGFAPMKTRLEALGIFVESEESLDPHAKEEPPVLLKNPKPARPFEFLIQLYSTPSYHELDPTLFLFVAFPFFFGFMIGDVGYGALFIFFGILAWVKMEPGAVMRRLLLVIGAGGVWAVALGLFIFGEAFGVPFHAAPGHAEELSWTSFGANVPLEAVIHKAFDVSDMVYLSILFAALHLGAGFLFGFVNEIRHSKKHAVAKLGWLMCLLGLFTLLTYALRWNHIAEWVLDVPLGWFPRIIEPLGLSGFVGVQIPLLSLLLILGALLALGESVIAPIEVAGLLANIMSYTRLAGIGIGKAAIAVAFNTIIIEGLIFPGQIAFVILGAVFLVLAQIIVFLLGGISAGIQALRLNYVEAFIKFYKGNGTRFRPFGVRATQEV